MRRLFFFVVLITINLFYSPGSSNNAFTNELSRNLTEMLITDESRLAEEILDIISSDSLSDDDKARLKSMIITFMINKSSPPLQSHQIDVNPNQFAMGGIPSLDDALGLPFSGLTAENKKEGNTDIFSLDDKNKMKAQYVEYYIARLKREIEKTKEQKTVIKSSHIVSWIVFGFVQVIAVLGIGFALFEIRHAKKTRDKIQGCHEGDNQQELMISLEGIALKTSFHGTIILVFCVVFYFLFVKYVYPLTPV